MKCASCGGTEFDRPEVMSSMEVHRCRVCGTEAIVHCNYVPDLSNVELHKIFLGTAFVGSGAESLKLLLKLKKALSFAERFAPEKLEEQHRSGVHTWELGYFLDFEIEQVKEECSLLGLQANFNRVEA